MDTTTHITPEMDRADIYHLIGSMGITGEIKRLGVTEVQRLGSGEAEAGNINSRCTFFRLTGGLAGPHGVRCAITNGDPVWETEDESAFADLAEACGVAL